MVNVGIIGGGMATRKWYLPELAGSCDATISAIATPHPETLQSALGELRGTATPQLYPGDDGWQSLLSHPGLDAVIIATPNYLHYPIILASLAAGKHVLVEKPLCINSSEGKDILRVADINSDLVLAVALKHRYLPVYQMALDKLNTGKFGALVSASASMQHFGPQAWSPNAKWFFQSRLSGGGSLCDLGPHKLDALLFLTGEKIASVDSSELTVQGSVDLRATAVFHLSGGATVRLSTAWACEQPTDYLLLELENGWIKVEGRNTLSWQLVGESENRLVREPLLNSAGMYRSGIVDHFVEACRQGCVNRSTLPDGKLGTHLVAVVEEAYRLARKQ